jgi:hypothetical protein
MSRLLRVGDKVINLDNIEFITRDESNVVRIHFIHGDIELWTSKGRRSVSGWCQTPGTARALAEAGRSRNHRAGALRGSGLYTADGRAFFRSFPSRGLRFAPLLCRKASPR